LETSELKQLREKVSDPDPGTAMQAAYDLARSGDPNAMREAVAILEQPGGYDPNVPIMASRGLVEAAPNSVDLLLERFKADPLSDGGAHIAGVLGDIVSEHGPAIDPRVVPALLEAADKVLTRGTKAAVAYVGALREAAWGGPLPEAIDVMLKVLSTARSEQEPFVLTLNLALEYLSSQSELDLTEELKRLLQELPPDHRLAVVIRGFLERAQAG
jgi:hypothetical protein